MVGQDQRRAGIQGLYRLAPCAIGAECRGSALSVPSAGDGGELMPGFGRGSGDPPAKPAKSLRSASRRRRQGIRLPAPRNDKSRLVGGIRWWTLLDSNQRPFPCQGNALTN